MPLSQPVSLEQLVSTGSTVTIEELNSTSPGGKARRVVLVGPGLPLKGGMFWEGGTNLVTTWYPGNRVGSQQVLGTIEAPSEMAGSWKRTLMGRAPSVFFDETGEQRGIVEPMDLYEVIDSIRTSGSMLRVTWAVKGRRLAGPTEFGSDQLVDRKIVREGRMKTFRVTPDTEVDVRWTITWDWVSRGGQQEKVANVKRDDEVGLATSAVSQAINSLDFFVDTKMVSLDATKRLSSSRLTLGQLEALANAPKKLVDDAMKKLRYNVGQFKRASDVARKLALAPYAMTNSVLDFSRNTVAVTNQFVDSWGRTPIEVSSHKQKVADLLRSAKYFGNVADQMTLAARAAADLEAHLRSSVVSGANRGRVSIRDGATARAGELIAIHVCKSGDTPTRVAMKYYGNPDLASQLLRANRLPLHTPTFRPGAIVVVPVLGTGIRPR